MLFLESWAFFGIVPLALLYRRFSRSERTRQIRLLFASALFMLIALARPVIDNSYVEERFDAHDYIVAIDTSYSMMADDLPPSRYTRAKAAIKKLFALHPKDRFTLFAFTSNALLISPPTTDTAVSTMALEALNPEYILTKSTSLASLFKTVAKLPMKRKDLVLFSDGGDEHDIAALAKIARENGIVLFIVATATQKGAALKKEGRYIKDNSGAIVISKTNPMLPDLADATGGRYYRLADAGSVETLSKELRNDRTRKEKTRVKSYRELFYFPLLVALVLFLLAVTRLHRRLTLPTFVLLLLPHTAEAGMFDVYYIGQARSQYEQGEYKAAAEAFEKLTPSVESYYNTANAWYKAGRYKKALQYYSQIRTPDPALKRNIYYNMGNCAAKLERYDLAERYYVYALNLGEDADALFNLNLLRRLKPPSKKDLSDMLPPKGGESAKKQRAHAPSKQKQERQNAGGAEKSGRAASKQSNASGSGGKSGQKAAAKAKNNRQKTPYRFSYKAYERINKGYTDEKEPW